MNSLYLWYIDQGIIRGKAIDKVIWVTNELTDDEGWWRLHITDIESLPSVQRIIGWSL